MWVIELAAVGDPAAVPDAVRCGLGITQQAGMSLADSVAAALEGRDCVCWSSTTANTSSTRPPTVIETIFARSSGVTVLATSREGLRLAR